MQQCQLPQPGQGAPGQQGLAMWGCWVPQAAISIVEKRCFYVVLSSCQGIQPKLHHHV